MDGQFLQKKKNAITITDSLENFLISSKRNPNLIGADRGKDFFNSIFQDLLNQNNIKLYSVKASLEAVFAERFNRTFRDLLKRPLCQKGESNWIDLLPTITKQYKKNIFIY